MDPLTLFALANGAVSAVKAGCKLYKDIQGAAGDVKGILKDLEEQFNRVHHNKPPTREARNQYIEEKNRVIELSRRDPGDVYLEIGNHLSVYYENYAKCLAVFEAQERSDNQLYTGEDSLGKRALQRVLMKKKLEAMGAELREIMVYQCPSELGALYTEVDEMMKKMAKQQSALYRQHLQQQNIQERKRRYRRDKLRHKLYWLGGILLCATFYVVCILWVVEARKVDYPEYGQDFFPSRVSNHDQIIADRNRRYWEQRSREYQDRLNTK